MIAAVFPQVSIFHRLSLCSPSHTRWTIWYRLWGLQPPYLLRYSSLPSPIWKISTQRTVITGARPNPACYWFSHHIAIFLTFFYSSLLDLPKRHMEVVICISEMMGCKWRDATTSKKCTATERVSEPRDCIDFTAEIWFELRTVKSSRLKLKLVDGITVRTAPQIALCRMFKNQLSSLLHDSEVCSTRSSHYRIYFDWLRLCALSRR